MNLQPKKSFHENGVAVKQHLETVDSASFIEAAKVTILQIVMELPETPDPTTALAAYHRLIGARVYMNGLLNLAEKVEPPKREPDPTRLNYQVK